MPDLELGRLERAAQRAPGDVSLLVRLGQAYERAQRLRDAFLTYARALSHAPDDAGLRARWERLGGGQEAVFCRRLEAAVNGAERAHAAAMLDVCGGPLAIQSLAHALSRDPNFAVRQAAAAALGSIGDPAATEHLLRALEDEHPWVRARAVDALHRLHVDRRGLSSQSAAEAWLAPRVAEWKAWRGEALGAP